MERRHIFSLVQLNTSCFDFAPASQKQRRLNDEAEIKQSRKAWSTRSTSGIPFVPAMASEEPVLLQGCSERGINLCCPWQKLCLCLLPWSHCSEQARVTCAAGKAQGAGEMAWKKLSEVSFHRDTISSVGREGQCLSLHTPMGHPQWLTEDLGKTGAIPFMAIDAAMVFSKLGLASHGSCRRFDEPKTGLCMLISTS